MTVADPAASAPDAPPAEDAGPDDTGPALLHGCLTSESQGQLVVHPTREQYLDERANPRTPATGKPLFVTDEEDLATAYLAALEAIQTGHGRFDAFFIAGDEREQDHNLSKAKRVLGWEPRSHHLLDL